MFHLEAGAYLMREGDPPTCGFLIEEGRLEVRLERPEGARVLAVLGPGEIVGEMALVDRAPRTASVCAIEPSVLMPITAEHFAARLAATDPVLRLVLGTVLDRLRSTLSDLGGRAASVPSTRDPAIKVAAVAELRLERELRSAIADNRISVHYQPIVALGSGRLIGFEALARWSHPMRGLIPPSVFVPIAEVCGLSSDLAFRCLGHVVRDLIELQRAARRCSAHVHAPRVSVNISGNDLTAPLFVDRLSEIASKAPGGAQNIALELTETALVQSPSEAANALDRARHLGFTIAVDDFGTGYSSLNYIRTLPVDCLKIDRTFVQGLIHCTNTQSIVASTVQLAHQLNIAVVGEGIETEAQRQMLQELGCELGQGYLFGRPAPLAETLDLLEGWRRPEPRMAISATA